MEQSAAKQPARGAEALVAAQLALLAVLASPARRQRTAVRPGRRALGMALVGVGGGLAAAGALALGPALTPSPLPAAAAELRTGGLYGRLRHPIYTGLTVAAAGRACWTGADRHRAAAAGLALLLQAKARYEERWLVARFPGYAPYAARTPAWVPRAVRSRGEQPCGS